MVPGSGPASSAVAANPPGGDLYFASAQALEPPGEVTPGGYVDSGGATGHADDLQTAPLAFASEEIRNGEYVTMASDNATGKGHVREVLNPRGSPAVWILLLALLVFGLLFVSAEFKVKAGKAHLGAGVVL